MVVTKFPIDGRECEDWSVKINMRLIKFKFKGHYHEVHKQTGEDSTVISVLLLWHIIVTPATINQGPSINPLFIWFVSIHLCIFILNVLMYMVEVVHSTSSWG